MSEAEFEDELIGPAFVGATPNKGDLFSGPKEKKSAQIENVLEWSARWEYQPGCQFVRVSREFPKIWEGIPIAGVIEEVVEPFDTDYLMNRWGGGTYKLSAIQLDPDGKSRTVDRKTVTLSGLPLCFRGPDGEPAPLPQSARVEEAMRRRAAREEYDEEEDHKDHVSAVDLYYAAQANASQNRSVDPEALEVIRRAQNDANEHMRANMDAQQRLSEQTIANQREELDRMRTRMQEKELTSHQPLNIAMQMMESRSQSEMSNMRSQLDAMRDQHQSQLQMIQSEHARVIESYQRELDRMREDSRLREDQVRSMVQGQYQGQIAALENRALMAEQNAQRNVEIARQDADRREAQMKLMLESGFDSRFQLVSSEKSRLQSELTQTRKELAEYRAIAMDVKDPIQQLQQMQSLVGAVQGFTGATDPTPPPNTDGAPDDFIGKIAHYGPGFAKHFLSPILSRVDAATEVANRQIQAREQEYEFVNRMSAGTPQLPQAGMGAPHQPIPVQQPQYHIPNPGQPSPPVDPGEGVIPDGMRKLVAFLDEKLQTNASPEDSAAELKMGLDLGIIPQDVYDDFVNRPEPEVIQDISAAASVMQLPSMGSPRGINFAQSLLSELGGSNV